MEPLTILLWLGVIIATVIVLSIVAAFAVLIIGAILGLRGMRRDEDKSVFKSGDRS